MRKMTHDGLSCGSINVTDSDVWSNNKSMMHPKISDTNADDFTTVVDPCLNRALLETERRFFVTLNRKLSQSAVKIVT